MSFKNRFELEHDNKGLKQKIERLEAALKAAQLDVELLNYRESKWTPGWDLPITQPDGTARVFSLPSYRASLRAHYEADCGK